MGRRVEVSEGREDMVGPLVGLEGTSEEVGKLKATVGAGRSALVREGFLPKAIKFFSNRDDVRKIRKMIYHV